MISLMYHPQSNQSFSDRRNQDGIHLLKVNNRKGGAKRKMRSKLVIKTPEQCQWCLLYCLFIMNAFQTLLQCFYSCLGAGKCRPHQYQQFTSSGLESLSTKISNPLPVKNKSVLTQLRRFLCNVTVM